MRNDEPTLSDPQVSPQGDVYVETLQQLAKPFPAIKLVDWRDFNKLTGGFRKHEFSIFCGGTGTGKTTFLANVSAQLVKQNQKHFVMSVETGRHDWMRRVLSVFAERDLNTGDPIPTEELSRIHVQNAAHLERNCIQFSHYEDRTPVAQLKHDLAVMMRQGCDLAMIDNLNFFMEVTSAKDQVVEMDRVIHDLIIFVKKNPIHIIMVMHPNKSKGHARVESEFDIKGSSTAVQEAQNVFLWNRPKPEDIESGVRHRFDRELTLNKMRRRGIYVGTTLIMSSNGTSYSEKGFA